MIQEFKTSKDIKKLLVHSPEDIDMLLESLSAKIFSARSHRFFIDAIRRIPRKKVYEDYV